MGGRISSLLAVGYIFLNAWVSFLARQGLYKSWGLEGSTVPSQAIDSAVTTAPIRNTAGVFGGTLVGVIQAALSAIGGVFDLIGAFPSLLVVVGVPAPLVALLTAPLAFILMKEAIYLGTGRDL